MKALKLAIMAALLAVGTTQTRADQTNLVENINIRLFGLRQGGTRTNGALVVTSVDTVRLETRHVIQALATATGNTFSPTSRLVLITPMGGGSSSVQVRDGSSTVDVTVFFALEQTGVAVTSSTLNTRTGRSTQISYSIQRFVLQNAEEYPELSVHFDVNGPGIETSTNPMPRFGNSLNVDASGNGDRNGASLVLQGLINISGQTFEVAPDDDDGGDTQT